MNLQVDWKASIRTNVELKSCTTFKIGGPARYFAEPRTREELFTALVFQREEGCARYVLGRGSNVLFSDDAFEGLVLSLRRLEANQIFFGDKGLVQASAGVSLIQLNMACQEKGLSGVEFLCHVPGTVGGAVVMNASFGRPDGKKQEMKDVVESIEVLLPSGVVSVLDREQVRFRYRNTTLPEDVIVLGVRFRLAPGSRHAIQEEIKANFRYRNSVQDLRYASAGSIFKNPVGHSMTSGQLLECVAMKNMRIGGAMVSNRHANFILNVDHARASDVLELMSIGRQRVYERFGVDLEPEIRYVSSHR